MNGHSLTTSRFNIFLHSLLLFCGTLLFTSTALGASDIPLPDKTVATVTSVKSGNWTDATVWDSGIVPTAADDVVIEHSVAPPNGNTFFSTVTIAVGGTLDCSSYGRLTSTGGITNNGTIQIVGGMLSDSDISNHGLVNWIGGALRSNISGGITLTNETDGTVNVQVVNVSGTANLQWSFINNGYFHKTQGGNGEQGLYTSFENAATGTVTVNNGKTLSFTGDFVNAGTMNGNGTYRFNNTNCTFPAGNTFGDGTGELDLYGNVVVDGEFAPDFNAAMQHNGSTLSSNGGTMTVPVGATFRTVSGNSTVTGFASITNAGTWDLNSGNYFLEDDFTNDGTFRWFSGNLFSGSSATLTNNGTLEVRMVNAATVQWDFVNNGIMRKTQGSGGNQSIPSSFINNATGVVEVNSGNTLTFSGSFTNAGELMGDGVYTFQAGTYTFQSGSKLGDGNGDLNLYGTITMNGTFEPDFTDATQHNGSNITSNSGEMTVPGGAIYRTQGNATLGGFNSITNAGTFDAGGINLFMETDMTNDGTFNWSNGNIRSNTGATFTNEGVVFVTVRNINIVEWDFVNNGTFNMTTGAVGNQSINSGFINSATGVVNVNNGKTLTFNGETLNAGMFNNVGGLIIGGSGVFTNEGSVNTTSDNYGLVTGNGTFTKISTNHNGSEVAPGSSPGCLSYTSGYTANSAGAQLLIEADGIIPCTEHDQLNVNGTATLSGFLNVTFGAGATFFLNDQITFIDASSISGTFSVANVPGLNTEWELRYNFPENGQVSLVNIGADMRTVTSVASGNWNDPTTWDVDRIPAAGDDVVVADGHTVTLLANSANFTAGFNTLTINALGVLNPQGNADLAGPGGVTNDGTINISANLNLNTNLVNTGTVNWTGGGILTASTPTIFNDGEFGVNSFGSTSMASDVSFVNRNGGTLAVNNPNGNTIERSCSMSNLTNDAGGEVTVDLARTLNLSGDLTTAGDWTGVGAVNLIATNVTYNGGTFGHPTEGTLLFSQIPNVNSTVTIGGSATFEPAFQSVVLNANVTLAGSGGAMNVPTGTSMITNANAIISGFSGITNAGTFTMVSTLTLDNDLTNTGTLSLNNGTILTNATPTIFNEGEFNFNSVNNSGSSEDMSITNRSGGTLAVVNPNGNTILRECSIANLTNEAGGEVTVGFARTLNLSGDLTTAGDWTGVGAVNLIATHVTYNGGTFGHPTEGTLLFSLIPNVNSTVTIGGSAAFEPAFQSVVLNGNVTLAGSGGAMNVPTGTSMTTNANATISGFSGITNAGDFTMVSNLTLDNNLTNTGTLSLNDGTILTNATPTIFNEGNFNLNSLNNSGSSEDMSITNRSGGTLAVVNRNNNTIPRICTVYGLTNESGGEVTVGLARTLNLGGNLTTAGDWTGVGAVNLLATNVTYNGGTFGHPNEGTLFFSLIPNVNSTVTIGGSATFEPAFQSVVLNGNVTLAGSGGAMNVPTGTSMTTNSNATISGFSGITNAGTINSGSNFTLDSDLTNTGVINWTGGTISSSSSSTIFNDADINITVINQSANGLAMRNRTGGDIVMTGILNRNFTVADLVNDMGATVSLGSDVNLTLGGLNAGNINNAGTLRVISTETLTNNGSINGAGTVNNSGTFNGTGSTSGPFNNQNQATLAPGISPGCLSYNSGVSLLNNGTLEIEVEGLTACTEHDQLDVNGTASLSGTLNVTFGGGGTFFLNDQITIIDANTISGTFNTTNIPGLDTEWELRYNFPGNGKVTLVNIGPNTRTVTSITTGDWNDPSTWDVNRVPQAGDDVVIDDGHVVQANVNPVEANTLTVNATAELNFGVNGVDVNIPNGFTNAGTVTAGGWTLNTDLTNSGTVTSAGTGGSGSFTNTSTGVFNISAFNSSLPIVNLGTLTVIPNFATSSITSIDNRSGGTVSIPGGANFPNPTLQVTTLVNEGSIVGVGELDIAGIMSGSGSVVPNTEIRSGGTLSPGCPSFAGSLTFTNGSTLEVEIGGTASCTDFDQLTVAGTININSGSTLSVTFLNGFIPPTTEVFTFIDASTVSGTFSTVIPALPTDFVVRYDFPATGEVTIATADACVVSISDVTTTDENCPGSGDGSLTIMADCPTCATDLEYSIDGGTTFQASPTFTGLDDNTYSIVVRSTDENCTASAMATLNPGSGGGTITSAQSGQWQLEATWVGGIVPTTCNDVIIAANHQVDVRNRTVAFNSITVNADGTLLVVGTSKLNGTGGITNNGLIDLGEGGTGADDLTINSDITNNAGAILDIGSGEMLTDNTSNITITNNGTMRFRWLETHGDEMEWDFVNNALVTSVGIPGVSDVNSSFINNATGTIQLPALRAISFDGADFTNSGTVSGPGGMVFKGANVTLLAGTLGELSAGGGLSLFGDNTFSGAAGFVPNFASVVQQAGATITGSGDAMTVPSGVSYSINANTTISGFSGVTNNGTVQTVVGGSVTLDQDVSNNGTFTWGRNSLLSTTGSTLTNNAGGTLNLSSLASDVIELNIINDGDIFVPGSPGTAVVASNFTNSGTVNIPAFRGLQLAGTSLNGVCGIASTAEIIGDGGLFNTGTLTNGSSISTAFRNDGFLSGDGTFQEVVRVHTGGVLAPGCSPGCLVFENDFSMTANSTELQLEVGGFTPCTDFDQLQVTGRAQLFGNLNVAFLNGFAPAAPATITFIEADEIRGGFSTVSPALPAGWSVQYNFPAPGQVSLVRTTESCGVITITDVSATQESCAGSADATVTVTANCTGCTSALEYSADAGATFQAGNEFTGLGGGPINIVVRDPSGTFCNNNQVTEITVGTDPVAPTANCVPTLDVNLNASGGGGMATLTAEDIDLGSFDPCGISTVEVIITAGQTTFDCSDVGQPAYTVTLGVENSDNFLTSSCTTLVTITDTNSHCNAAPVANCIPQTISADMNCQGAVAGAILAAGSTDDQTAFSNLTITVAPSGPYGPGTTNVTVTVTDEGGLSDNCSTTVTVVDDTNPITPTLDLVTVDCGATVMTPITTDACAGTITATTTDPTTYTGDGQYMINWNFDDGNGNDITVAQTVNVVDATGPSFTCPGATSMELNVCDGLTLTADAFGLTGTDNCGGPVVFTFNPATIGEATTTSVSITATDESSNVTGNCTVSVTTTANDEAFTITAGADDLGEQCPGEAVTFTAATLLANDNTTNSATLEIQEISLTDPADGALVDNGNGSYTFTPAVGVSGIIALSYVVKTEGSDLFFADNGHFYEFVADAQITWSAANAAASALTLNGQQGYLATITSQAENDFVQTKLQGTGWMGASDADHEGAWRWVTGPEAGQQFWLGNGDTGGVTNGAYANWKINNNYPNEPNNDGGSENYAHFLPDGKWNDWPNTVPTSFGVIQGYVVEYGAADCTPNQTATGSITLNVEDNTDPITPTLNLVTVDCGATIATPTTTDACAGTITATTTDPTTFTGDGQYMINWNFDDGNGNDITVAQTVNVVDATGPAFTCPGATSLELNVCDGLTLTADAFGLTGTDNCGGPVIFTFSPATVGEATITSVSIMATDESSNVTGNCTVSVTTTANDEAFTITAGADDLGQQCRGEVVTFTAATLLANDNTTNSATLEIQEVSLTDPADGALVDNGDGSYTLTPAVGVSGTISLTYVVKTQGSDLFFADNGHFYEFVDAPDIGWLAARDAAAQSTLNGQPGYLVTITSQAEQNFVTTRLNGFGWMGGQELPAGSDAWFWSTGPEAGQKFWQGRANGSAPSGAYENWHPQEPNNATVAGWSPNGEAFAHLRANGQWNDYPETVGDLPGFPDERIDGYVVEYGAADCTPDQTATGSITLTLEDSTDPETPVLNLVTVDCGATIATPTTTDVCAGTIMATTTDPTTFTGDGQYIINWNFDDGNGNDITVTQTVNVVDATGPSFTCPGATNLELNVCDGLTLTAETFGLTGTDNCGGPVVFTFSPATIGEATTTSVSITATDESSNITGNCTVSVTTTSNDEAFTITAGTDDLGEQCPGETVTFTAATLLANDNATNSATLEIQEVSLADPADGALVDNGDGSYTFTPAVGMSGIVSLSYIVKTEGSDLFFADNGHFYEYVAASSITWDAALAAAASMTLNGQQGYLATVTSQAEQDFITSKLEGQGWMGANDLGQEHEWEWVTGPEAGTVFWSGLSNGAPVGGSYTNWNSGEPNDSDFYANGESYVHFRANGTWNDYPNSPGGLIHGYIVEYGAADCVPDQTATGIITVNLEDSTPAQASCNATVTAQLDGSTGEVTVTTGDLDNGSSDNCVVPTLSIVEMELTFDCVDVGQTVTLTLSATDGTNAATTCTSQVTIASDNFNASDFDNDGVCDAKDLDDDNDGILDEVECSGGAEITLEFNGTFGNIAQDGTGDLNHRDYEAGGITVSNYSYSKVFLGEGNYAITNFHGAAALHAGFLWSTLRGHTTGTDEDAYLAVNGNTSEGVFYREVVTLQANTSYELGVWAANGNSAGTGAPNIGIRLLDDTGNQLITTSSGPMNDPGSPWNEVKATYNTGANTEFVFEVYNISLSGGGNDFAIDDVFFRTEALAGCNADGNGNENNQNYDSDGDGCDDVIEAGYADGDEDGQLGTGAPTVDANGLVVGHPYTTPDGTFLNASEQGANCAPVSNCDVVAFPAGGTLISFDVDPGAGMNNIADMMSGDNVGKYFYMAKRTTSGQILYYAPTFPQYSTGFTVEPGEGIYVYAFQPNSVEVCGTPISPGLRPELNAGYTWVGYMPQQSATPASYFGSISQFFFAQEFKANISRYYITLPQFAQYNNLPIVENGLGYQVYTFADNQAGSWLQGNGGRKEALAKSQNPDVNGSGVFQAIFGDAPDLPEGSSIKVVDDLGNQWGELTVGTEGRIVITAIFGADEFTGALPERKIGTELFFEHDGLLAEESFSFTADESLVRVNLAFESPTTSVDNSELNVEAMIFPNPFRAELTVRFTLDQTGPVTVNLTDVTGRLLKTKLLKSVPANGEQTVRLETARLPTGMYLLHLEANGSRLLTEKVHKIR